MKDTKELIDEEQQILHTLINKMDNEMLELDSRLTRIILESKKAQEKCLPDTYGMLVEAASERIITKKKILHIQQSKDELYDHRIVVEAKDDDGSREKIDLKIGLHTYAHGKDLFVCTWKLPICRHYILDNTAESYEEIVEGKHGEKYHTTYQLKLKRKIDLHFTKVKNVTHMFPLNDAERIVADEFLQELLDRRSGQEFKNIVFSIQKQQGLIIQSPFNQNMIVQGCAGSGKSMIMLHRLPILLYDNPIKLHRNNLYIITPSQAYIQMADNMRHQLEISDLKMGTLEQYYDFVMQKYGYKDIAYDKINFNKEIPYNVITYIYSDDCIQDIRLRIKELIDEQLFDFSIGNHIFNISAKNPRTRDLPYDYIVSKILESQSIIVANQNSLHSYYKIIKDALDNVEDLSSVLAGRKSSIIRSITRKRVQEEKTIDKSTMKLKDLNKDDNRVAYNNQINTIELSQTRIRQLNETQKLIETDIEYFQIIELLKQETEKIKMLFKHFKKKYEDNTADEMYDFILNIPFFSEEYKIFSNIVTKFDDKYQDLVIPISNYMFKVFEKFNTLNVAVLPLLKEEYYIQLVKVNVALNKLKEQMSIKVYTHIMDKIGKKVDEKGKIQGLSYSPYLYLQIIYQYQGAPNGMKESLITIDEAQGLAVNEFLLIKNVNNNKVILNLFGDERQHIEGTKGIDSWSQLQGVSKFDIHTMLQNYRNARQITDYCNKKFNMNMHAINLDGSGVHQLLDYNEFNNKLNELFLNVRQNGLAAIIVKNMEEAKYLLKSYETFKYKLHDMTGEEISIHHTRWNIITVDEAKGLEFGTVIAITGRMTQNEKYITYTRALDELFVYDNVIDIPEHILSPIVDNDEVVKKPKTSCSRRAGMNKNEEPRPIDYSRSKLTKFFIDSGLEVIDQRPKGGGLWVMGDKDTIDDIISQATNKFNVSGMYSTGKPTNYKPAWYTKSKK